MLIGIVALFQMHKFLAHIILAIAIGINANAYASGFDNVFADTTLRFDIRVAEQHGQFVLGIDKASKWEGWHGRRTNLTKPQYPAAISYALIDSLTSDTIYTDTKHFSIPFPWDWHKPLYSTIFVPYPKSAASLSITLYTMHDGKSFPYATKDFPLSDLDKIELISPKHEYTTIREAIDKKSAINLAIVAEGYTKKELPIFLADAQRLDSILFTHDAYKANADRFNVIAVMLPSDESGISRPSRHIKVKSALNAHFDSYNLDRLITLLDSRNLWDAVAGMPASQIMILCNTEEYGGSGPYNEYAIASAHNPWSMQTIIHEFGHSFANLGDEYEAGFDIQYTPSYEPDEPNITTLNNFSSKWKDMLDNGEAMLIEGAGYQSKGVYRGWPTCIMRALPDMIFCPVCTRALQATIDYYTQESSNPIKQ